MRILYTRNSLDKVYNRIVSAALKSFSREDYEDSLKKINLAANLQYNVNSRLTDERLEKLLKQLSESMSPSVVDYEPVPGKVLFYDYFGISNRGLTQQYLDALFQIKDLNLCYVLEHEFNDKTENIIQLVKKQGCNCYELKGQSYLEKIKALFEIISQEKPERILYHIAPSSPVPLVATYPFKRIKKYLINITDHAFGLGDGSFFDYSFEFREYGCKVSLEKRNYDDSQLLLLPYYPWQEPCEFQGFPINTRGKVVLFSGAFMYKIEDAENTFFHIVRRILQANDNAIMLFAGGGDPQRLQRLINDYGFSKRFFILGNRTDISEVYKHIDIFVGTYPLGGGLMSQYASINAIPILAYKTHDIENVVCNKKKMNFVFDEIDNLVAEAGRLINDSVYREKRGLEFQSLTATQGDFRISFQQLFLQPYGLDNIINEKVDYHALCKQYIDTLNHKEDASLERKIAKGCFMALDWRMIFNIMMNTCLSKHI